MMKILMERNNLLLIRNIALSAIFCILMIPFIPPLFLLLIMMTLSILVTVNHIKKTESALNELVHYLKGLNNNDFSYDLKSFEEGTFSILKSEIHKTTHSLIRNNEQLESQRQFIYKALSDISHQLKTPISGLVLMLQLLDENRDNPEAYIQHSKVQVERLEKLVKMLLKLIQLEARAIPMKYEKVAVLPFIETLVEALDTPLEIEVIGSDYSLIIDPIWTYEAIFNVLSNKTRYAHEKITIKLVETQLGQSIEVSDDGPFVKLKERDSIFERFYKGEGSDSDSIGIGLAMSREIMNVQSGKLYIKEGNTFVFSFSDNNVISKS